MISTCRRRRCCSIADDHLGHEGAGTDERMLNDRTRVRLHPSPRSQIMKTVHPPDHRWPYIPTSPQQGPGPDSGEAMTSSQMGAWSTE